MWFDDNIKEYAEINYIINKKYCNKYGYDIIKSNCKITNLSHQWERFPLVIKHIKKYDYIIWIDSDACFLKDSPPISNVINEHNEKLFIFSGDVFQTCDNDINLGFFIVKNSEISINILNELYTNPELIKYENEYFNIEKGYMRDQGALRHMYKYNLYQIKDYSIVIKYGILQAFPSFQSEKLNNINKYGLTDKAFVVHLAGNDSKKRIYFSKNYLKYNFCQTCKCGFKKDKNKLTCCILCDKSKGHGPLCKKINDI
jgi:hypothetical protein